MQLVRFVREKDRFLLVIRFLMLYLENEKWALVEAVYQKEQSVSILLSSVYLGSIIVPLVPLFLLDVASDSSSTPSIYLASPLPSCHSCLTASPV
ncbi:hypothetical protein BD408DRAFT_423621 [Parasitella parasitica]|nr:hypothetical protein BD408DRAFT_423621 [Parasitella parasitica]